MQYEPTTWIGLVWIDPVWMDAAPSHIARVCGHCHRTVRHDSRSGALPGRDRRGRPHLPVQPDAITRSEPATRRTSMSARSIPACSTSGPTCPHSGPAWRCAIWTATACKTTSSGSDPRNSTQVILQVLRPWHRGALTNFIPSCSTRIIIQSSTGTRRTMCPQGTLIADLNRGRPRDGRAPSCPVGPAAPTVYLHLQRRRPTRRSGPLPAYRIRAAGFDQGRRTSWYSHMPSGMWLTWTATGTSI